MTSMSAKRFDIVLAALTRAADEWASEEAFLNNYGEGPKPDDRAELTELRRKIETLELGREALMSHYRPNKNRRS